MTIRLLAPLSSKAGGAKVRYYVCWGMFSDGNMEVPKTHILHCDGPPPDRLDYQYQDNIVYYRDIECAGHVDLTFPHKILSSKDVDSGSDVVTEALISAGIMVDHGPAPAYSESMICEWGLQFVPHEYLARVDPQLKSTAMVRWLKDQCKMRWNHHFFGFTFENEMDCFWFHTHFENSGAESKCLLEDYYEERENEYADGA